MASQYNVEPQPTGKVILNTTAGDLTLELFGQQTPLATRNFLQHCLDGYYNNTIFHRLVSGFVLQGGDPTGTGSGGISAINNGEPFEDEFHSRLKFNRRGLLGMANEGKNNNTSQFFLTLGPTPELQGMNTMFGRIEGDTIFNLMKMAEGELAEEGSERPLYPVRIVGSEILVNPFRDMVARVREAPRTQVEESDRQIKKRKKPTGRNILSFGDEGDDTILPVVKKSKANTRLVQVVEDSAPVETMNHAVKAAAKLPERQLPRREPSVEVVREVITVENEDRDSSLEELEPIEDNEDEITARDARRKAALERTNAEIAALKASMKRSTGIEEKPPEKPRSALEAMIPASSTRGRKRGRAQDEAASLDLFNAFKSKLDGIIQKDTNGSTDKPAAAVTTTDIAQVEDDDEAALCDLHFIANCQSCKAWDDDPDGEADEDKDDSEDWMNHKLTFAKDTLGKDLEWKRKMEEIEVIDPREKARTIEDRDRKTKHKSKR